MKSLAVQACMKLFGAGGSAGEQGSRSTVRFSAPRLLEEFFAHRHAEVVEVLLVPKTSGHTTTFHRRSDDVETDGAQQLLRLSGAADGFLLAVRMIEDAGTDRRSVNVKQIARAAPRLFE